MLDLFAELHCLRIQPLAGGGDLLSSGACLLYHIGNLSDATCYLRDRIRLSVGGSGYIADHVFGAVKYLHNGI